MSDNEPGKPRVVVLLAARNGAPWIAEQIRSILNQLSVDVNIFVADDKSTDGTAEIIAMYFGADARVTLLRRNVPSGSAGRNFIGLCCEVDFSAFDYVAFADQDDVWNSDKLIRAISCITSSTADAYSASVQAVWPSLEKKILVQNPHQRSADHLFEGGGQGCTFVMRVGFLQLVQDFLRLHRDAVGGFHYHDWLIYLLARAWNKRWYFDCLPCMEYRQHPKNEIGALAGRKAVMRRIGLMRGGWYRQQIVAAAHFYTLAGGHNVECLAGIFTFLTPAPDATLRCQRMAFAFWLLRNGRRRTGDRIILALAALVGWI